MTHGEKVERLAAQIRGMTGNPTGVGIRKGSEPHFVPNPFQKKVPRLDLRELDDILEIDARSRTCTAESGVTFDALTRETLRHGLIPTTVPELRGITIGGAVAGCSVES
ncbi:MAG: FAD-binding protein, partial [Deltaproteobacteria bacterium]|nr:FAD-binding protein [Deltaproteobacteria bacterium]